MKEIRPEDILIAREERVEIQQKLIKEYNLPLVCLRVNYPGVEKDNSLTRNIAEVIKKEITSKFMGEIAYEHDEITPEGPIITLIIDNIAEEIKRKTIDVEENHILGRCVDIDVYDSEGNGINRGDLGLSGRKCFLCQDNAQNCVRSRRHNFEEVIEFLYKKYAEYESLERKTYNIHDTSLDISGLAAQAMLYEVACTPSPGLVSTISTGAHDDMDHYTFIESTCALMKYMTLCTEIGFSNKSPKDLLREVRIVGLEGEKAMFEKTRGVNTHKGMLFLMGISCVAVGNAIYNRLKFKEIRNIIMKMCQGLVEKELLSLKENHENKQLSYGEKLYLLYNIEGVRGEIERGLPIIFEFALNFYKENSDLDKNNRLVQTLLGIMQYSEDSNILHRHSINTLKEINEKAKEVIRIGGVRTEEGREALNEMNEDFAKRRISPGGSADLLALTVFFCLVEGYMEKLYI
ncbi:triphosphoribosyl-dephospho-CoA synthase CitG [Clostridium malenominatum]|uniref:Triphosphoribosyl-dephospho-CoA synthase CitG n=1 Tax=Clostridium malenominatum TaxID=1539 RepID=A0ABP3TR23_9CLOT